MLGRPLRSVALQFRARNQVILDKRDVNFDTIDITECSIRGNIGRLHHNLSSHPNGSIFSSGKAGVEEVDLIVT